MKLHGGAVVRPMAILGLSLALAACALSPASSPAGAASPSPGNRLDGTEWELRTIDDQPLPDGIEAGITFSGALASGSSGCNTFSGPYRLDASSLDVGPLASTEMACAAPSMAFEQTYLTALEAVTTWAVPQDAPMGTQLTLTGAGPKLVFAKPAGG